MSDDGCISLWATTVWQTGGLLWIVCSHVKQQSEILKLPKRENLTILECDGSTPCHLPQYFLSHSIRKDNLQSTHIKICHWQKKQNMDLTSCTAKLFGSYWLFQPHMHTLWYVHHAYVQNKTGIRWPKSSLPKYRFLISDLCFMLPVLCPWAWCFKLKISGFCHSIVHLSAHD